MGSRYFLKSVLVFTIYVTYLRSIRVDGAITLISHLRRQESEESNHMQNKENVPDSEANEPGFALDEEDVKKFHIWHQGIIPYYIDDYSFDKVLRDKIRAFLEHINRMTGLRFLELPRPPDDSSRWVFFINRLGLLGCADHAFKGFTNKGVQKVVVGYDCINTKNGLAETILSLIGVPPQHNAPNRDEYIEIILDNIMPEKQGLFKILKDSEWLFHELEYDFRSAGHYDTHKYTVNGGASIKPRKKISHLEIEDGNYFSYIDVKKIRMLYNYISNDQTNERLPECSKMFSPGTNFSNYQQHGKRNVTPRKKPNRYLGLPDKASEQELPHKEKNSEEVDNVNNNIHNTVGKDNTDNEKFREDNTSESVEEIIQKSEESLGENTRNVINKYNHKALALKRKPNNQTLLDLSDFSTEEYDYHYKLT